MREIKFRGLRDTESGDTKWVFGDLSTDNRNCAYKDTHPHRISWREGKGRCNAPVRKGTTGQYTGLLDKNEKEIYEGDIVRVDWEDSRYEPIVGAVEWDTAQAEWSVVGGCATEASWSHEVLGNIHENPELLNQE